MNRMESILGLKQEADLDNIELTIRINNAIKLFDSQHILKEVEGEIFKQLAPYGANREDLEVIHG